MEHPGLPFLILNVIAITMLTSLTMIWYLKRLDRQTLTKRMSLAPQSTGLVHAQSLAQPSVTPVSLVQPTSPAQPSLAKEDVAEPALPEGRLPEKTVAKRSLPEPSSPTPERRMTRPVTSPNIRPLTSRQGEHLIPTPVAAQVLIAKPVLAQGGMAPVVAQWSQRLSGHSQTTSPSDSRAQQPELSISQQIVFPTQSPKPAVIQRLAGPIELRRSMAAAKYGRSSC